MTGRRSKAGGMEKEETVHRLKVQKLKVRLESPAVKAAKVIQSPTKPIRLTRNQTSTTVTKKALGRDVVGAGAGETRKKPRQTAQLIHQAKVIREKAGSANKTQGQQLRRGGGQVAGQKQAHQRAPKAKNSK